ncbi:MAG: DUF488 domain-containing protein [Clostridia bacterium]|nr:DUF488 domain-containing protein [Clostridia bacterium]
MHLYTIGFTKTTAEDFFERLREAKVRVVLDVRLKNTSQLAGFARMPDIQYFLRGMLDCRYVHDPYLAPTDEILSGYKKKEFGWDEYEARFDRLMDERNLDEYLMRTYTDVTQGGWCLLCSEDTPEHCHRRLIAGRMEKLFGVEAVHL